MMTKDFKDLLRALNANAANTSSSAATPSLCI